MSFPDAASVLVSRGGKEMHYVVPLLAGGYAELWLSRVLAAADADRMAAFLATLPLDAKEQADG